MLLNFHEQYLGYPIKLQPKATKLPYRMFILKKQNEQDKKCGMT